MFGHMRQNRIRNEGIREKVGVTSITEKTRKATLRWFGHIRRTYTYTLVKRSERINLPECQKGQGRPKNDRSEAIRHNLNYLGVMKDMTQDKNLWRSRIEVHKCIAIAAKGFGFQLSCVCCNFVYQWVFILT